MMPNISTSTRSDASPPDPGEVPHADAARSPIGGPSNPGDRHLARLAQIMVTI